jgi:hypothetical protein
MKCFFTIALCLIYLLSFGQAIEENIVASLDSFSLANPQEKAYLQTDRTQFNAGETIWFKTFVTLFEKPGILSKVVYVTLSNDNGIVLQKKQLKLANGSAAGNIELPKDLKPGHYILNTYTLWMLNFPEFISTKNIAVFNSEKNKSAANTTPSYKIKLQFFPEGGQMIAGLSSPVAFKAIDEFNRPVSISGSIMNSKNKAVASFLSIHNGMGILNFIPESGETYTAEINGNAAIKKFDFPVVLQEGITLAADNSNVSKTFIKLQRSEKNKERYNNLLLVAQQNYQVVYMANINFDEGKDAVAINKKNLAAGMLQITVFSIDGIPLAERSVFISNYTKSPVLVSTVNNHKRAKNNISLDLSSYKNPDAAVSIINSQAETASREHNILSALLLSSDIKGNIYQPAAYFKDQNSTTLQQLDLLMMVHGWSRFNWTDVRALKFPPLKYPFETSLSISGKVKHINEKTALKSGKINLIIKGEDSTTIMSEAVVNSNSDFVVADIDFKKEATIYYQGTNQKSENALVSVKVNTAFIDSLRQLNFPSASFAENEMGLMPPAIQSMILEKAKDNENNKRKLLEEVVVKSKKLSAVDSMNNLYASAIFENSDQTLLMDQGNYFDIWQYLQRMVPGISIDKTDTGTQINFSRYSGLSLFTTDGPNSGVQLFLNEVPVSSNIIDLLDPSDVSLVKIFKGTTGIILGADRGAIAIYTKKGGSARDWRVKGFDFIKKAGYNVGREFYAMDYSLLNPESDLIDVRPTLYWNPHLKITNGKASIEFYNDDISKKSKLIIEGIDENGKLFSIEKLLD